MLLDHGVSIKVGDFGKAALLLAAENGHEEVVKMLLKHGADATLIGTFRTSLF